MFNRQFWVSSTDEADIHSSTSRCPHQTYAKSMFSVLESSHWLLGGFAAFSIVWGRALGLFSVLDTRAEGIRHLNLR